MPTCISIPCSPAPARTTYNDNSPYYTSSSAIIVGHCNQGYFTVPSGYCHIPIAATIMKTTPVVGGKPVLKRGRNIMQHKRRGQSMVEMALLLPLFLVLIFGIIDMGYIIYSYATLYQATREAAEVASVAPPYPSRCAPQPNRRNSPIRVSRRLLSLPAATKRCCRTSRLRCGSTIQTTASIARMIRSLRATMLAIRCASKIGAILGIRLK